ncbi:MAG: carbamoyltransferase HypF [Magnetococcales bacterium]|nr:carbamoyltransferase HypF [Magnetococcales bacterium]
MSDHSDPTVRWTMQIMGVVQGVGFRPALHRLATAANLGGWVENHSGGVHLELIGNPAELETFVNTLPDRLPPMARIDAIDWLSRQPNDPDIPHLPFHIRPSRESAAARISIPPDLAVCLECLAEITDPNNRRYGYPFTSCTACGPRYTVLERLPYDRAHTALRHFPLCHACQAEYDHPLDRRFHAESTACPRCGPCLLLTDHHGHPLPDSPLPSARRALAEGKILAVRGLGGYQLMVDPTNREAIRKLRDRKTRPDKPLAIMAVSLYAVQRHCQVTDAEIRLLRHPSQPIVILPIRPDASGIPVDLLSPDSPTLGMMLPTTPLHHLLFHPLLDDPTPPFELLVATSGNPSGEPLCIDNHEAVTRLGEVADLFVQHDRTIIRRNDDSVAVVLSTGPQIWRRARGLVPDTVRLPTPLPVHVLAMGADLKNTFALGFDDQILLSPHIGDLRAAKSVDELEQTLRALLALWGRQPEVIAIDLHPDLHASRLGQRLAIEFGVPVVTVQHHHAHALACMAEHGVETGLGLIFDGVGLGTDGIAWGAELLQVTPHAFQRLATFASAPLPGGDQAVARPLRQLIGRLAMANLQLPPERMALLGIRPEEATIWAEQARRGLNAPPSHGAGRLFDAFSALLGASPAKITYEGQAAIRLESLARTWQEDPVCAPYRMERCPDGLLKIHWEEAFAWGMRALAHGEPPARLAMALHHGVAEAACHMARHGAERTGEKRIYLSGGVFMNRLLNEILVPMLHQAGLTPHVHARIPPNDNGISLGQAIAAGRR